MRHIIATLVVLLLACRVHAQLRADAGPDKALCTWRDSPALGGFTPASGGLPPYHYAWNCVNQPYSEYYFLDNPHSVHPRAFFSSYGRPDSLAFNLTVTDSLGNHAYDTVSVLFNNVISYFFSPIVFKGVTDTVQLKMEQECADKFGGYHDLIWTPGTYLLDSTVMYPLCYAPKMMSYRLSWVNRIGCRMCAASTDVEIQATGVNGLNSSINASAVTIANGKLIVNTGEMHLPCRILLYDISGQLVLDERLLKVNNEISLSLPLSPGLYVYNLSASDGAQSRGKLALRQ